MKSKVAYLVSCLVLFALLTGCDLGLMNLTPSQLPQNPSSLYNFMARVKVNDTGMILKSLKVYLVINGQTHLMHPTAPDSHLYTLDYSIPPTQAEADYYYYATYQTVINSKLHEKEVKSELCHLDLINRGVSSIETNRGPVGARVAIVGKGFTKADKVLVGEQEAPTQFVSPHALRFTVPPVKENVSYPISVSDGVKHLSVGTFLVDSSTLQVSQKDLHLRVGEKTLLVLSTTYPAPDGGLPLEITTDIPEHLIIPELTLPQGLTSVTVPIEATQAGNGYIFIEAPGFKETSIRVTISDL